MNTFFLVCIVSILLNAAGITFSFPILNIIGSVGFGIGIMKLPVQGTVVKKAKIYAWISVVLTALIVAIGFLNLENVESEYNMLASGLTTFFYIYLTYYFTEALVEHSKFINELASTRTFRGVWTLTGIIAFLYFIICMSNLTTFIVNVGRIVLLISAIFYCSNINSNKKLFTK